MSSEIGPVIFRGQGFKAVAIPESVDGAGEEARLRAAPIFVYEADCSQYGSRYEFGVAFLFNGNLSNPKGGESTSQFELSEEVPEDDAGTERTLTIKRAEGETPFESLEIIPLDWEGRPVAFTQLEADANQKKLSYRTEGPPNSLKIRLDGLNVLDFETIAVRLSDPERQYTSEPLTPLIKRDDAIRIDKLSNPTNEKRKLEEHLTALFDTLSDKLNGRAFQFDCGYRYQLAPDSTYVSIPVIKGQSLRWDAESFKAIADLLPHWRQTVQPETGDFVFKVTLLGLNERELVPVLQLTQMLLPSDSIAEGE